MPIHIKGAGGGQQFEGAVGITELFIGSSDDQPNITINESLNRLRVSADEVRDAYGLSKIVGVHNFSAYIEQSDSESGNVLTIVKRSGSSAYYVYIEWYGTANPEDAAEDERWIYTGKCNCTYNSSLGMLEVTECPYLTYVEPFDKSAVNVTWAVDLSK